jgi:glycosyltransferase involved in cell wall biosynthesis
VKADISVVIPSYQSARWLPAAVASVHAQPVAVREVIVVDDGSQDDTAAVAASLPGIQYVRQQNAGPAAARNTGIERAQGEWVAFLDADDTWTPDRLSDQLATLARHPSLVLLASDMCEVLPDGRVLTPSVLAKHGLLAGFQALDGKPVPGAARRLLEKNFIPTGTVLVRREALDAAGRFPAHIRWGEDLALWTRIAAHGDITCLPKVHMLRLQHGANATAATRAMLVDLVQVAREVAAWGREPLAAQGLDVDELIARACNDLGYFHFDRGEFALARAAFAEGLVVRRNWRGLKYRLLASLPAALIQRLRGATLPEARP